MLLIVGLRLRAPFQPEGTLTAAGVAGQRADILRAQTAMGQLLAGSTIPFAVTMQSATTPVMGLDIPESRYEDFIHLAFNLIATVTEDRAMASSSVEIRPQAPLGDASAMVPIGYAYDPVASDVVAMQQLALDAGTPPVLIGVEEPVVGDWGANGSGADAFLVVTATTPPAQDIVTLGAETPEVQTTTAPPAAAGIAPEMWGQIGMGTWLLIGVAVWLLLRGR